MIKIALREVWAHATRFILTIVSVVLGVAFLSGTLALRDSLEDTFVQSFAATTSGTIQVEGQTLADDSDRRARIDPALAEQIRQIDGVRDARPVFAKTLTVLKDGSPATGVGMTTLAMGTLDGFTPWTIEGDLPSGPGEIAFEVTALQRYGFEVGDRIEYLADGQRHSAKIVSTIRLAAEVSPLNVVSLDADTVRSFKEDSDLVSTIAVQTEEGTNLDATISKIEDAIGSKYTVRTAQQVIDESADAVKDTLGFVTTFLLVFVVLALGVSTFIIANTFHMAVKARQKEFAYLRAVGASPAQVFWQVAIQALVIGIIGSALGIVLGKGLLALAAVGLERAGMASSVSTALSKEVILISFVVGTLVTLLGAVLPARAAAQTPPVEAMREMSGVRERPLWPRALVGGILIVAGAVGVAIGAPNTLDWAGTALGVGAGAVVIGVLVASPAFAKAVIGVLAWPLRKIRSTPLRVGAGNAVRNPRRTSATAGALIIGMGLVTLGTVLASSVQASTSEAVQSELHADFMVASITPGEAVSDEAIEAVRGADGVASVNDSYRTSYALSVQGNESQPIVLTSIDTKGLGKNFDLPMTEGRASALNRGKIVLPKQTAEYLELGLGDEITIVGNAATHTLEVGGVHESTIMASTSLLSPDTFDSLDLTLTGRSFAMVFKAPNISEADAQSNIREALGDMPTLAVYSKSDVVSQIASAVNMVLAILYALLGLSIIVAVVGIVNTLGLGVSERATEIALMRAIGTPRVQMASTIVVEAILTSLYGTIVGILVGLGIGVGVVKYTSEMGVNILSIPWGTLGIMLIATIIVGALAAIGPGLRAARQPILDAIASE